MDRETARLVLASYRPQDASDPIFAEALRQAAEDPELAAWFEEMQRFDAVMPAKFRDVPVPPEMKSHILLRLHATPTGSAVTRSRGWIVAGSIAALLLLGLLSAHFFAPRSRSASPLEAQAISYSAQMPALQFVCFDADAVAQWVNEQPGAQSVGVKMAAPGPGLSMSIVGSSVVAWNGRPVVMVCLQDGRHMAMLYILKASDADGLPEEPVATVQKAGWVVRTTRAHGQVRLLTAKGGPEALDFPTVY